MTHGHGGHPVCAVCVYVALAASSHTVVTGVLYLALAVLSWLSIPGDGHDRQ